MSDDITTPELVRWLARVEGKIDKVNEDHETRIRVLERRTTGLAVLASVTGTASVGAILDMQGVIG
jgi:hypothetical protein